MGKPGLADSARGSAGLRVVIPRRPRTDSRTFDLAVLAERCTAQMEVAVAGLANAAIHANTCDPPDILFGVQAIFGFSADDRQENGKHGATAVAEAIWEIDGGRVRLADLRCRDPERFCFRRDGTPLLITRDAPRGIELPEAKFCVLRQPRRHGGEPHGPGAARWCLWPVWLKRTGIRYWSVALEKFGAPALTCTVRHNAEPPEIAKALEAMGAIIGGASTVLQEGQEIELLEATRRAGGDYATFTAAMDAMIADAVLGQRATSEIGPWQATAEIHAEVLQRLVAADARRLQAALRHSLAAWLTHWNHPGAATPRLARDTAPAEDLERRARRDAEIAAMSGLRPTQAYIERTYGGEWEEARQDAPDPAAPPLRRALADPGDGDAIAAAVDRLIGGEGWEPLMEPLIQPVLDAARTSDDIEAFGRRIDGDALWEAMETAPLAERLHRASFSAAISAAGAPVEDTAGDGGGEP